MVQIRQLSSDDPALAVWRDSIRAGHLVGREAAWWESLESMRVYLGRAPLHNERLALGAFAGGRCVGGVELTLPLQYDTETLSVELGVRPEWRGRGVGTTLLDHVTDIAVHRGRTVQQTEVHVPAGQKLADSPGGRFALSRGLQSVNTEDRFLLTLPLDESRVAGLAGSGGGPDDYTLHSFVDRAHRGHRLGARLKWANLRNLAELGQRTAGRWRWVQTYTEQHNTAMQHTNEAFGFRRVDVLHELEGPVGGHH